MATIETSSPSSTAAVTPPARPVVPQPAVIQPQVSIQQLAAESEGTRNETASDLKRLQQRWQEAISEINSRMQSPAQSLNISVDEVANRFVVTVKNETSGELIRFIPDETTLRIAHNMEAMKGILLDGKW